ncbi:hypothetical protein BGZ61DRAFT_555286 [Ilyonectria robusta]|uniref:uncharacterized protein n=1 Tax=Ilyonectria robusta TaxID=1079257 RepID=UPI001E8E669C|nr:uncharacterized protein BGZ61DRAFT_555286 [Ilyonectria robusta]KAH8672991.1 hypothetical protein BGZ61DRAFT_555286 [Ilyonectria robusta]
MPDCQPGVLSCHSISPSVSVSAWRTRHHASPNLVIGCLKKGLIFFISFPLSSSLDEAGDDPTTDNALVTTPFPKRLTSRSQPVPLITAALLTLEATPGANKRHHLTRHHTGRDWISSPSFMLRIQKLLIGPEPTPINSPPSKGVPGSRNVFPHPREDLIGS